MATNDLLEIIASLTEGAAAASKYLEEKIDDVTLPSEMKVELLRISTLIKIQSKLTVKLMEENLTIEDNLKRFIEKHESNK